MKNFLRRLVTGVMVTALLSTVGVAVHATPAADSLQLKLAANTSRPITIVTGVRIRPTPDTSQHWLTVMPAGSHPQYICYVDGENEQGTTKWFQVGWDGVTGYYSSVADDIPLSAQNNIEGNYGIPRCGTGTDINQGSDAGATVNPAPTNFDRSATVGWALQNARNGRLMDRFPDCTWFVSQALWYGGFHQSDEWNSRDHHGFPLWPIQGTAAATAAPDLVAYLIAHASVTVVPLTPARFHDGQVPEAQLGDIIAYRWHTPFHRVGEIAVIDHLALVTNIVSGNYLEVSEWGTSWPTEPYTKRGWTWSENSHMWLQDKFRPLSEGDVGVTAVLLHFNY